MSSKTRLLRLPRCRPSPSPSPSKASPSSTAHRLSYHAYDRPPPPGPFTPTETAILSAALPHVPTHGFTPTTLALGAKDAGYVDASINLFPRGAFALVQYHLVTQRLALARHAQLLVDQAEKPLGIAARVKALTWYRLMQNKDIIHRWQEALALSAQPTNIPPSLSELAALADEIWFLAGDTAVDGSWYTKRGSLASVYAATELFMTTDASAGFGDTREFLDRRFRDVRVVGGVLGGVTEWVGFTAHAGLNVLRSKGFRV